MIYAELPMTRTREATNSQWAMMALSATDAGGNRNYSVTVLEFRGKVRTRRVIDRYVFEPAEVEAKLADRAFLVSKTHHSGDEDTMRGLEAIARMEQGEVYKCQIGNSFHRCTCVAGNTEPARPDTAPCVHVLCARTMAEEGAFDEDETAAPTGRTSAGSGEWGGRDSPANDWWAEAAGGRRVVEPAGL